MKVKLIIPRHKYRSLDGQRRESISLSPEGKAALDRLATCSRSAAAGFAIRALDAVVTGDCDKLQSIGRELASMLDGNDALCWVSSGFAAMSQILDSNLKIELSDEN